MSSPNQAPQAPQTPEQMSPEEFARRTEIGTAAGQFNTLVNSIANDDAKVAELSANVNNIIESAAAEPEKLGKEIMSPERELAYKVAEAYVNLASVATKQDTKDSMNYFTTASAWLKVEPAKVLLKRDYADNMSEHQEKQAEHFDSLKDNLSATWDRQKRVQQNLEDAKRKIAHNQKIDARKADEKARADARQSFYKLFPEATAEQAEMFAEDQLGPKPADPNVVDTEALKADSDSRAQKSEQERRATAEARSEFQKGFKDQAPKAGESVRTREQERLKYEILEKYGFRKGADTLRVFDKKTNTDYKLEVIDAYINGSGNTVFKVRAHAGRANGDDVRGTKEPVKLNAKSFLDTLESSDKYLQSAKRPRPTGHGNEKEAVKDALDEIGARKRDELRRALKHSGGSDPATVPLTPLPDPSLRKRTGMRLKNVAFGAFNRMNTRRGRIATGLGVLAAAVLVGRGYIDQDTANTFNGSVEAVQIDTDPLEQTADKIADGLETDGNNAGDDKTPDTGEGWAENLGNPDSGDGVTHSFVEYAESQGKNISPERSLELFRDAKEAGLITEDNISNLIRLDIPGGVGLDISDSTKYSPELIEFLNRELKD